MLTFQRVSIFIFPLFGIGEIFLRIGDVVGGIVCLTWSGGLDILCGHPTPYLVRGNLRVLQYQGTCGNDGTLAYLTAIEQHGTHAYEGSIVNGGREWYRHVPSRYGQW